MAAHPFDSGYPMRYPTALAVTRIARLGAEGVRNHMRLTLTQWKKWAGELENQERALHARLHAEVEAVVKGKRILLFKRILKSIGYRDVAAADLLVIGAPIIGELQDSAEFPPLRRPPTRGIS